MTYLKFMRYSSLIYLFCFVVAGCGGGSESSSEPSSSGGSDNSTTISGLALSGGVLSEADITLSQLSESGSSSIGNEIKTGEDGTFLLPASAVNKDNWYKLTVSGGYDTDVDSDGIIDTEKSSNSASLSLIAKGEWLLENKNAVVISPISDLIAQGVGEKSALSVNKSDELISHINSLTDIYLNDQNSDGRIDFTDLMDFDPLKRVDQLKIDYGKVISKYLPVIRTDSDLVTREQAALSVLSPEITVKEGVYLTAPSAVTAEIHNLTAGKVAWNMSSGQPNGSTIPDVGSYSITAKIYSLTQPDKLITQVLKTVVLTAPATVQTAEVVAGNDTLLVAPIPESIDIQHNLAGASVTIPDGAIAAGTQITLSAAPGSFIPTNNYESVGDVLILGPSGTQFSQPVSVELPYDTSISDPANLLIARYSADGTLDYIVPNYIDEQRHIVGFTTEHFTAFQLKRGHLFKTASENTLSEIKTTFPSLSYSDEVWSTLLNYKPVSNEKSPTIYDAYQTWQSLEKLRSTLNTPTTPYLATYREFYDEDGQQYTSVFSVIKQVVDFPSTVSGYYGDVVSGYDLVRKNWGKIIFDYASGIVDDLNFTDWYIGELLDRANSILSNYDDIVIDAQIKQYFMLRDNGSDFNSIRRGLLQSKKTKEIVSIDGVDGAYASSGWFSVNGIKPVGTAYDDNIWNKVEFLYQHLHSSSNATVNDISDLIKAAKTELDNQKNPYAEIEFGWAANDAHLEDYRYLNNNRYQVCSGTTLDFQVKVLPYGKTLQNPAVIVGGQDNKKTTYSDCEADSDSNAWTCQIKREYSAGFTKPEEREYSISVQGVKTSDASYRVLIKPTKQQTVTGLKTGTLYTTGDFYQLSSSAMFANGANLDSTIELYSSDGKAVKIDSGIIYFPKESLGNAIYNNVKFVITPKADLKTCQNAGVYQGYINLNSVIQTKLNDLNKEVALQFDNVNGGYHLPVISGQVTVSKGDKVTFLAAIPTAADIVMYDIDGDGKMSQTFDGTLAHGPAGRYFTRTFTSNGTFHPQVIYRITGVLHRASGPQVIVVDDRNNPPVDANTPPVAKAGSDVSITVGDVAVLNGGASTDSDGFIASYQWFINGELVSDSSKPQLKGLSVGSHDVVLTVTDNRGQSATDSVLVTVKPAPARLDVSAASLDFGSFNYVVGGVKIPSKQVTITNGGGLPLTNVKIKVTAGSNVFSVSEVGPFTLDAAASKGITVSATSIGIGDFTGSLQITADGGFSKNISLKAAIIANNLVHRVIPSASALLVNDALTLRIEMTNGNPEYAISVNWGDGQTGSYSTTSDVMSASHTYTKAFKGTIQVTVNDFAGKTGLTTLPISVSDEASLISQWYAQAHHIETDETATDVPIQISEQTLSGNLVQRYTTSWVPASGSNNEYFIKYRLPVPAGLIKLDRKMRMTVVMSASSIAAFDRELAFVTDQGEMLASWRGETEPALPGYLQYKPIDGGTAQVTESVALNDDPQVNIYQSYAVELNNQQFDAQSYANNSYSSLANLAINGGIKLNELNITFKGNGAISLVKFEYDANNNGVYDDGAIFANTADKTVDWSVYSGVTPPVTTVAGHLNDTGITSCADDVNNNLPCPVAGFPGQDAESGRDAAKAPVAAVPADAQAFYLKSVKTTGSNSVMATFSHALYAAGSNMFEFVLYQPEIRKNLSLIGMQLSGSDSVILTTEERLQSGKEYKLIAVFVADENTNLIENGVNGEFSFYVGDSSSTTSSADDSDGHAGFSFTKLDSNGQPLAASATEWSCVKDNVTGLIWEIHTDDGGLRDKNNIYSWYNPDATTNGGDAGTQNGGSCTGGIACDTQSYVTAMNAQGLCGYHDWRMPTVTELQGLMDYSIPYPRPTIDTNYFPDTQASYYWSSSAAAGDNIYAMSCNFYTGECNSFIKVNGVQLRLVRSGQ